jgi:hypothetical protein
MITANTPLLDPLAPPSPSRYFKDQAQRMHLDRLNKKRQVSPAPAKNLPALREWRPHVGRSPGRPRRHPAWARRGDCTLPPDAVPQASLHLLDCCGSPNEPPYCLPRAAPRARGRTRSGTPSSRSRSASSARPAPRPRRCRCATLVCTALHAAAVAPRRQCVCNRAGMLLLALAAPLLLQLSGALLSRLSAAPAHALSRRCLGPRPSTTSSAPAAVASSRSEGRHAAFCATAPA